MSCIKSLRNTPLLFSSIFTILLLSVTITMSSFSSFFLFFFINWCLVNIRNGEHILACLLMTEKKNGILYLLHYVTVLLHWHWFICFWSTWLWSSSCCCVCCIFDVAGGCCQLARRWGNSQGPQLRDNCPLILPLIGLLMVGQGLLVPCQSGHEVLFQISVMSSLKHTE